MAGSERTKVTKEELYDLVDRYKKYYDGVISIFDFLGLSPSSSDEEIKRRCREIRRLIHYESWVGSSDEYELASKYVSNINSLLDGFKTNGVRNGYSYEDSSNNYYSKFFIIDRERKIERLRKLLEKDPDFEYNRLDSLVDHYVNSTILYISSLRMGQFNDLARAYNDCLGLVANSYKDYFGSFVRNNHILINDIKASEKLTYRESLKEFARKLGVIKSKYSLCSVMTSKLNNILNSKKRGNTDVCAIEAILKTYILDISSRELSSEEEKLSLKEVILRRGKEFEGKYFSAIATYRDIKSRISNLRNRYSLFNSSCIDKNIKKRIDIIFNELGDKISRLNSFDGLYDKIDEVSLLLEKVKFRSRILPKINRIFKDFCSRESSKCNSIESSAYYYSCLSKLSGVIVRWLKEEKISVELLIELLREIDINNQNKTERILRFLNYSGSGIFVRRKESYPSEDAASSFYVLDFEGQNSSNFLLRQINSSEEVRSCPIKAKELFEFYLPLDEVVFLDLKYYFKSSDFDGVVMCDDISNGYFLLSYKDGYAISVGENGYSYNVGDILSIDGVNRYDMFTSLCDFVRGRFKEYKNKIGYSRR